MIYIVGLGPGHRDYILPKALKVMEESDIIIGFKRALDSLDFVHNKKVYMKTLSDLDKYILKNIYKDNSSSENENTEVKKEFNISIVASGDPTFYGITNYIKSKAELEFEIIPGISSFQYLTSKVKLPWNNAYLGSLHGRNEEFLEAVNKNEISIWLTDKENNPAVLCDILIKAKVNCKVIIGENLSYEDEIISAGTPEECSNREYSTLSIFIIDKSSL